MALGALCSSFPPIISPPGLLATARQLDRENKDEHILEVSDAAEPIHHIRKPPAGGQAGTKPGHGATCTSPGSS